MAEQKEGRFAVGTLLNTMTAVAAVVIVGAANAALIDRGGGMVYDSDLHITWLSDWNLAKTSGHAGHGVTSDGRMTWAAAVSWATNLEYGGFDDWRLPTMVDTGEAGCNFSYAGGTDCGYYVQTKSGNTVYSEMAHLFYVTLDTDAYCKPGPDSTADNCAVNPSRDADPLAKFAATNGGVRPFANMEVWNYWFGLLHGASLPGLAWVFSTDFRSQAPEVDFNNFFAVAVRDGDVVAAVPEPQTLALVLLGLGAAAAARRR